MGSAEKPAVVVTGFGPFEGHPVNASWEAVKELKKLGLGEYCRLVIEEIPVQYDTVLDAIPVLWKTYKPALVVHCGVSGMASELTLEQQANLEGYCRPDVSGCAPKHGCCHTSGDATSSSCIVSGIDMSSVASRVNSSGCGLAAVVSHDAGRYLCEFTYYSSLNQDSKRAAFIHVPPLGKPYSAAQLAQGIRAAVLAMLDQTQACQQQLEASQ